MGTLEKLFWKNDAGQSFHYFRYLPKNVGPATPLVFFLHGAGERGPEDGSALDLVKRYFWLERAEAGEEFPFIMLAPQCPNDRYWGCFTESLNRFLDDQLQTLPIDPDRVYLTGLSMGGTGTWHWSIGYPERFAAVAPVCGTGIYWYGRQLANVPVWAFHGDQDDIVPPEESLSMIHSVNRYSNCAKLTIVHGVGHNSWDAAYEGTALIDWMLAQRRK